MVFAFRHLLCMLLTSPHLFHQDGKVQTDNRTNRDPMEESSPEWPGRRKITSRKAFPEIIFSIDLSVKQRSVVLQNKIYNLYRLNFKSII